MRRKLTVLAAVLVVGGAFAGWAVTASARPSAGPTGVAYHDHTVSGHNVDAAPSGPTPGDQFVFHDVLSQNGQNKGTVNGVCEVTQFHPTFAESCTGTAKIGDSQLNFQLGGGDNGNKPFKIGITGGTGQYRTARGYIVVKPINNNNSTVTIYVMP
jgi:hypothetical protein